MRDYILVQVILPKQGDNSGLKRKYHFLAMNGKVVENDDTIKRSIIRSIVRQGRKLGQRSISECLDLRLSLERL